MGLLDKLRSAINLVEKKLQEINLSVSTSNASVLNEAKAENPLADEKIKKYFEIICNMKNSLPKFEDAAIEKEKAKKYIEYFLEGVCDEEKLENALALYHVSNVTYPSNEIEKELRRASMEVEEKGTYRLGKIKARKLFCQEEIATAMQEYNKILEVIKDNVNYLHFSQGMRKMECDYTIQLIVIADSFCSGNPITQKLIIEYLIDSYIARYNKYVDQGSGYHAGDDISLLIIKALHFEKYGHDRANYPDVDDESYRDLVMNVNYYKETIDNHPFDTEMYIEKFANRIKKDGEIFGVPYTSFKGRFYIEKAVDGYFTDAACNLLWKEIAKKKTWLNKDGEDISQTRNYNDLFLIFFTYFSDPDGFDPDGN